MADSLSPGATLPKAMLIFLAVDWPLFMRRQMLYALAEAAGKHGSTIVAINRPLCPVTTALRKPGRIPELFRPAKLEQLDKNLYLFSPRYFLHDHLAPKIPGANALNIGALRYSLRRLLNKLDIDEPAPVVWYYYPQQGYVADLFADNTVVYDLYDFPGDIFGVISETFEQLRLSRVDSVDLLLSASTALQNEYAGAYKNSLMIGNGLDRQAYERFLDDSAPAHPAVMEKPYPRIGFAGMISEERLNWRILEEIAQARPEWSFVFAGRLASQSCLKHFEKIPNLSYVGEVTQADVPSVVRGFDVGIMPYLETEFFRCSNALKFYELSAAGVPMVTSGVDELRGYPDELVTVAEPNAAGWIAAIESQLNQDRNLVRELGHKVAAEHLWSDIADRILRKLSALQKRR